MSVLTTSQLTFCDLKDSYSVYLSSDCIGLACDNSGLVTDAQTITINYSGSMGVTRVGLSCEVSNLPEGVVARTEPATDSKDGKIILDIEQGATLGNEPTASIRVVFTTTDSNEFIFEKYITFVKYMTGENGTDAVSFQIYSVDGFEFSDSLQSITLETVTLQKGQRINGDAYQWQYWSRTNEGGQYEDIKNATQSLLTVNISDGYAFQNLKCIMTYDGIVYEDYISLTQKTPIYTAVVKFWDGSNAISSGEDYITAYVDLYKDNSPVAPYADPTIPIKCTDRFEFYNGEFAIAEDGCVNTGDGENFVSGENFQDGDLVYVGCQVGWDLTQYHAYNIILVKYKDGNWYSIPQRFTYVNDCHTQITSPIIKIPAAIINGSLIIEFEVLENNSSTQLARSSAMVLDLNDAIIGSAPTSPKSGQLWLDTSVVPNVLKIWSGDEWVDSSYQKGNTTYTSKPENGYVKGDIWILNEDYAPYNAGSMLIATETSDSFDILHWRYADKDGEEQKQNIKQYFAFNKETGLKIGQTGDEFYVNISSTKMGFYDNSNPDRPNQEVVSISNQSANIKNATIEDSASFLCPATFNQQINMKHGTTGFVWKIETNGSLSLSII